MKVLVVYESMYGNTAAVGEAIAASLRDQELEVDNGLVSKVEPTEAAGVDLLIVGGPTHIHGMSRSNTRQAAVDDEKNTFAEPTLTPGLKEWMDGLPSGAERLAAAFATRIDKPALITGSAAKGIAKRLERHGYRLVVGPESFLVSTTNALLEGETDRATTWSTQIAGRAKSYESTR